MNILLRGKITSLIPMLVLLTLVVGCSKHNPYETVSPYVYPTDLEANGIRFPDDSIEPYQLFQLAEQYMTEAGKDMNKFNAVLKNTFGKYWWFTYNEENQTWNISYDDNLKPIGNKCDVEIDLKGELYRPVDCYVPK